MPGRYGNPDDLPQQIPLFPLTGALLLPRTDLPLNIFEPRYLVMVEKAMAGERIIGIIQPQPDDESDRPRLERVGCAGRITSYSESDDGRLLITLTGVCRFIVKEEAATNSPYREAVVDYAPYVADLVVGTGTPSVNREQLLEAFRQYLAANDMTTNWDEVNAVGTEVLVNTLALLAPYPPREKQALLEAPDLRARAEVLVALTELALKKSLAGGSTRMQ
jgi:Lon protease-like protein